MTAISISLSCSASAAGCWALLLVFIQSAHATVTFPDIKIPSGYEPHSLGRKNNWGELEAAIKPVEGFRVTSVAAEAHLAKTRTILDESKNSGGWGIIHYMVGDLGGDNDALLEKLLALGLHPDLESSNTWRPSHLCSLYARPKSAKAISLCRPNLSAKNKNNDTPLEAARESRYPDDDPNFPEAERAKIRPAVVPVWEDVEKNGFPSIAEMAKNKQWFAVQNLLRRGVVCRFTEGSVQHQGRTAIEWAVYHRESSLAEEIRYFLERHPSDLVVALDQEAKRTATKIEAMDTKLDVAQNITDTLITTHIESEAKQSKLLQELLEEMTERQTRLEEEVHQLKAALEAAHIETRAYLYSSYMLLDQSLDNDTNNTTADAAVSNKSNMAKPTEG